MGCSPVPLFLSPFAHLFTFNPIDRAANCSTASDQCLKIWSAWVNKNQSQYAVTATTMAEKVNLLRRQDAPENEYEGIIERKTGKLLGRDQE
jgi:hypothetical protein